MNCPVCEHNTIDIYQEPIEYWCCKRCGTVFVMGDDGTISALDIKVVYNA